MVRHARTPEGSRRYKVPIGAPIVTKPVRRGPRSPLSIKPSAADPLDGPDEPLGDPRGFKYKRTGVPSAWDHDRGAYPDDWTHGDEDEDLLDGYLMTTSDEDLKALQDHESAKLGITIHRNVPAQVHQAINRVARQYDGMFGAGFSRTYAGRYAMSEWEQHVAWTGVRSDSDTGEVSSRIFLSRTMIDAYGNVTQSMDGAAVDVDEVASLKGSGNTTGLMYVLHHEMGHAITNLLMGRTGAVAPNFDPWDNEDASDEELDAYTGLRPDQQLRVKARRFKRLQKALRGAVDNNGMAKPRPEGTTNPLTIDLAAFAHRQPVSVYAIDTDGITAAVSAYGTVSLNELLADAWAAYAFDPTSLTNFVRDTGTSLDALVRMAVAEDEQIRRGVMP